MALTQSEADPLKQKAFLTLTFPTPASAEEDGFKIQIHFSFFFLLSFRRIVFLSLRYRICQNSELTYPVPTPCLIQKGFFYLLDTWICGLRHVTWALILSWFR